MQENKAKDDIPSLLTNNGFGMFRVRMTWIIIFNLEN